MANSPSHRFGQVLGNLLEYLVLYKILKPRLETFTATKNYYLDWQKARPIRQGKKVTWNDKYNNKHDLDFVIELGGSETKQGMPVAFIEAAWRRYTKHSKNKAQEIQGALLPIIELHHLSAPFYGAVLAGEFTKPALAQLRNNKFTVLYIPYQDVVQAFSNIGLNIAFDEETPDEVYVHANKQLANLTELEMNALYHELANISKIETDRFIAVLQATLERFVIQITLIPLYGTGIKFNTISEAISSLSTIRAEDSSGVLHKIEVIVDYNNSDTIRASFINEEGVADFLKKLGN